MLHLNPRKIDGQGITTKRTTRTKGKMSWTFLLWMLLCSAHLMHPAFVHSFQSTTLTRSASFSRQALLSQRPKPSICDTTTKQRQTSRLFATTISYESSPNKNQTDEYIEITPQTPVITVEQEHPTPTTPQAKSGVAIVVNANAGGISSDIVQMVQQEFGSSNKDDDTSSIQVHVTYSIQQAQQAIDYILQQNPALVIPMGGDGTLTTCIESLQQVYNDKRRTLPMFAYIAMGTGNALGTVIGCQASSSADKAPLRKRQRLSRFLKKTIFQRKQSKLQDLKMTLQQLVESGLQQKDNSATTTQNMDMVELPMLKVTTTTAAAPTSSLIQTNGLSSAKKKKSYYCFFAGVGFDSLMLQDYQDLQEWARATNFVWKNQLTSVFGYCVTLVTRTLPKCIFGINGKRKPYLVPVEITTNQPDDTVWVDHRRGDVVRRVAEGRTHPNGNDDSSTTTPLVLYKGIAGIVAASTTPYYGGNLKLFPFARMSLDKMQLRIGRIHPMTGMKNLPWIFQGSYRDLRPETFGCLDFLSNQFTIRILQDDDDDDENSDKHGGYPVQHSGESIGHCQEISLQVMPNPIRFVTLLPPRLIYEDEQRLEP